jgi:hypothetical protein
VLFHELVPVYDISYGGHLTRRSSATALGARLRYN